MPRDLGKSVRIKGYITQYCTVIHVARPLAKKTSM